jgi:hypothetical protein
MDGTDETENLLSRTGPRILSLYETNVFMSKRRRDVLTSSLAWTLVLGLSSVGAIICPTPDPGEAIPVAYWISQLFTEFKLE